MPVISETDYWETARRHFEKESRMFMSRLLRHLGLTQIELPMYPVSADEVVEWTDLPNGNRFYRIKGQWRLDGDSRSE